MSPSTCEKKDFSTSDTTQHAATWRRVTATINFANYPWATIAATPSLAEEDDLTSLRDAIDEGGFELYSEFRRDELGM